MDGKCGDVQPEYHFVSNVIIKESNLTDCWQRISLYVHVRYYMFLWLYTFGAG